MALSIKSDRADRLARELAHETGESITEAVTTAIEDRLTRERRAKSGVAARLRRLREELQATPRRRDATDDEILGLDEHGLPS